MVEIWKLKSRFSLVSNKASFAWYFKVDLDILMVWIMDACFKLIKKTFLISLLTHRSTALSVCAFLNISNRLCSKLTFHMPFGNLIMYKYLSPLKHLLFPMLRSKVTYPTISFPFSEVLVLRHKHIYAA